MAMARVPHGHGSVGRRELVRALRRQIQLARDAGALTVLPLALNLRAGIQILDGQFATAETLSEEAHAVSDAIANPDVPHARLFLAAWRGRRERPYG